MPRINRYGYGKSFVGEMLAQLVKNFFDHRVSKNAASLAYHLLFALFPLLIFISNLIGMLDIDIHNTLAMLRNFLPKDIVDIAGNYLEYVSLTSGKTLLWFSLVFSLRLQTEYHT